MTALSCLWASFDSGSCRGSRLGSAEHEIGKIAGQAQLWVEEPENDGVCPSIQTLIAEKSLPSQQDPNDPWGQPYRIVCGSPDYIEVISAGADKTLGTPDDVSSQRKRHRRAPSESH
ncbi:MAG: type II secretion system protein GspG [Polyangiaceae bacterium]